MKRNFRKKRMDKKLHKSWLHYGVVDAVLDSYWRKILFAAKEGEFFVIDENHTSGLLEPVVEAIKKYKLHYMAAKVNASEAEPWLSNGGLVIFKIWSRDYPSVAIFTGNNPAVV